MIGGIVKRGYTCKKCGLPKKGHKCTAVKDPYDDNSEDELFAPVRRVIVDDDDSDVEEIPPPPVASGKEKRKRPIVVQDDDSDEEEHPPPVKEEKRQKTTDVVEMLKDWEEKLTGGIKKELDCSRDQVLALEANIRKLEKREAMLKADLNAKTAHNLEMYDSYQVSIQKLKDTEDKLREEVVDFKTRNEYLTSQLAQGPTGAAVPSPQHAEETIWSIYTSIVGKMSKAYNNEVEKITAENDSLDTGYNPQSPSSSTPLVWVVRLDDGSKNKLPDNVQTKLDELVKKWKTDPSHVEKNLYENSHQGIVYSYSVLMKNSMIIQVNEGTKKERNLFKDLMHVAAVPHKSSVGIHMNDFRVQIGRAHV